MHPAWRLRVPSPSRSSGALPSAPAYAANPVTPGNFTGLGFDQCEAPSQSRDECLDQEVAVPRGRHLHLRQLAGLPHADEPDADLGAQPARRRLAPDADHARAAGVVLAPLPALRQEHRPDDHPDASTNTYARPGPRVGPRPRRQWRPRSDSASSAGARSSTTSRPSTPGAARPAPPRRCGSSAPGPTSCTPSGYASGFYSSAASGIRMLDDARVSREQPDHAARPDLDRGLERQGQHQLVLHPQRRVAALPPPEAVPGRPQRDVGRRDDQHRPQLPQAAYAEASRCGGSRPLRRRPRRAEVHRQLHRPTPGARRRPSPRRDYRKINHNASPHGTDRPAAVPAQAAAPLQYEVTGTWNGQTRAALYAFQSPDLAALRPLRDASGVDGAAHPRQRRTAAARWA